MTRLYKKLSAKKLKFGHVCEVGVYVPETSNVLDFINDNVKTTLVEADPEIAAQIKQAFASKNVIVHAVAVWHTTGFLKLSKAASSTFATDLPTSPALENDRYHISNTTTFEVPCVQFSTIDDGTIELLSIDIEGAEWYVLKYLQSQPQVLSIETHGKYYTNPFLPEITSWLKEHNYVSWYKDGSDSVYIKNGLFPVSLLDKLATRQVELLIGWKKFKRIFKQSR
ncbi:FkbM family methyltransferase [Hymenobacter sp. BRD128]|uniref:FkbM family methyltransferase n=1 Tax=Hymenobacter sp. BRD128 TaxID=2675878 RepID=UPI001566B089|nr:FkbM family methyltransferase [Hymenobacter sp. BRD128]QKG58494.1 FkbM family methyltransferase [Hymenobacter sp. BRD128]